MPPILCLLFIFYFLVWPQSAQASYENNFPSLAIGSKGSVEQISSALKGVHSTGKLVVIPSSETTPEYVLQEIAKLPADQRARILVFDTKNKDEYLWIRDKSTQWQKQRNGKWALRKDLSKNSFDLDIALSLCTDGEIGTIPLTPRPESEDEMDFKGDELGPGGNILNDGYGACAIGESAGWNEYKIKTYEKEFNCKKMVMVPKEGWPVNHQNQHADLIISFVGPRIALVPKISEKCEDELTVGYRQLTDETTKRAEKVGIEVHRINVSGCPITLDSPVNLTETKEAFILPRSENPENYDNTKNTLLKLMENKKVPTKSIVPVRVNKEDELINGGSLRCLTLPIPATLQNCSQTKLNQAVAKIRQKAAGLISCLDEQPNAMICKQGSDLSEILWFMTESKASLVASNGKLQISKNDLTELKKQMMQMSKKLERFCKSTSRD